MSSLVKVRLILPILVAALLSACASGPPNGEAPIPGDAKVTHRAVFIGKTYHDTVGTISLYQSAEYPVIVFEPNFKLPNGKAAIIALGQNGYRKETSLGVLARAAGRQSYAVPKHLEINRFNEVWLWHNEKNIALGLARLTPI